MLVSSNTYLKFWDPLYNFAISGHPVCFVKVLEGSSCRYNFVISRHPVYIS